MKKIIITNGVVIDPANGRDGAFDVLVENGRILEVSARGSFSEIRDAEKVDVSGSWVTPGLVDVHVHLREPGYEWKETVKTGVQAAVSGGFTTVCCMANTSPVNDRAEITGYILEKAREAGLAAVKPIGAISQKLEGKELAPMSEMKKAGCVAFSDDGNPVLSTSLMRRALEWSRMIDAPLCLHEEDTCLCRDGCMNESALSLRLGLRGMHKAGEDLMIARDIELARAFGGRIHFCHISSARSVELVRRAKNDGIAITAEVTPHHLTLTEALVKSYDGNSKMNPPLREEEDLVALLEGLKDGTIDAVASDHAPHEKDRKVVEFDKAAFGIIGLQSTLPLMLGLEREGKISRKRLVESLSCSAAAALGLSGCGSLSKGSAADISIIDPKLEWRYEAEGIRSLSKNSPYIGQVMKGGARMVLCGGKVVVRDGRLLSE